MTIEQFRMGYPKYKVFIFGVEVSDDVISINATHHDGAAPNTCQITILNELDKYIVTTQDLIRLNGLSNKNISIPWLDGTESRGEVVVDTAYSRAGIGIDTGASLSSDEYLTINESKRKVLEAKRSVIANSIPISDRQGPDGKPPQPGFSNYFNEDIKRYPLADGAPIFHAMDQVRVFMRDPFNPGRWYHHFAGFISDMVDNADENNVKTLTILVEDVTKLFRYSRIFINPGILDASKIIQDNDLKVQSFYANFLRDLSLPEVMFTLLFGPDKVGNERLRQKMKSEGGESNLATRLRGIGHFDFSGSGIFTFGSNSAFSPTDNVTYAVKAMNKDGNLFSIKSATNIAELKTWDAIIDHEVHPSDLYTMLQESIKANNGDALASNLASSISTSSDGFLNIEEVVDQIGRRPDLYPVDGGRLLMLIPNGFGAGNSELLTKDLIQSYPMNSEWQTAGEIMFACIERIQFSMYASPKGDLIVEPPLYDFDPDDFGMSPISSEEYRRLVSGSQANAQGLGQDYSHIQQLETGEFIAPSRPRGPFGANYVIRKNDTYSWESAIIDEKIHTIATCSENIFQNWDSLGSMAIIGSVSTVKLPELIPLYGARQISATAPGYIETPEGAFLYASIVLNRQNADAHTFRLNAVPNIALRVNRPIYIEGRNCISTTKQINQSITWGQSGDMSTTLDLYATRTWNGQVSTDNPPMPIYTPIGGNVSSALNYATIYRKRAIPVKESTTDSGPSASAVSNVLGNLVRE